MPSLWRSWSVWWGHLETKRSKPVPSKAVSREIRSLARFQVDPPISHSEPSTSLWGRTFTSFEVSDSIISQVVGKEPSSPLQTGCVLATPDQSSWFCGCVLCFGVPVGFWLPGTSSGKQRKGKGALFILTEHFCDTEGSMTTGSGLKERALTKLRCPATITLFNLHANTNLGPLAPLGPLGMVLCHGGDLDGAVCFGQGFGPQVQQRPSQCWHIERQRVGARSGQCEIIPPFNGGGGEGKAKQFWFIIIWNTDCQELLVSYFFSQTYFLVKAGRNLQTTEISPLNPLKFTPRRQGRHFVVMLGTD